MNRVPKSTSSSRGSKVYPCLSVYIAHSWKTPALTIVGNPIVRFAKEDA